MRNIEIPTIKIDGEEYPIYCDLYVLSQIQEKMSISEFERQIIGAKVVKDENGDPEYDENNRLVLEFDEYRIDAIILGLKLMINEGLQIMAEQGKTKFKPLDEKELLRAGNTSVRELSNIVMEAFSRCFHAKKNMKA